MRVDIKSVAYAFASQDVNVYFPDGEEECFMIEKLVCTKCDNFWHTSLMECYFCGELNYYLYECTNCKSKYSITNSSKNCLNCQENNSLIKACINEKCPTNQNEQLKELNKKEKGVFDLTSSLNLSLMYCINCGCPENKYKTFRIFVYNDEIENNFEVFMKRNEPFLNINDIIVFKKHNGILKYNFSKIKNTPLTLPTEYKFKEIANLVENILKL
ncbi:MAG: hypothetical protein EAZ85_01105 [Bacteroidetes bacterium]|nr:MAG: hypothetical protein EAZ85_01105 [Bacteroidota bacterium]